MIPSPFKPSTRTARLYALCSQLAIAITMMAIAHPAAAQPQQGITTELFYLGEAVQNFSGGLQRGTLYHATGDLTVTVDTEEAGWWPHGTLFIDTLINNGADPSARLIGDVQTASNISDGSRTRLQQLWYEQQWGENLALLVGLHDLNSEFYVTEYGTLFLNSSFGVGPDLSSSAPVSIWPQAGAAARLAIHVEHFYLLSAIYDGDPTTRAIKANSEGLMYISEAGWSAGATAYKVGIWHHTGNKIAADGRRFTSNSGGYAVIDQPLAAWKSSHLSMFLQLGINQQDRNDISNYLGAGLHLDAPFSSRPDDVAGIAVARSGFSPVSRRVQSLLPAETAIELTYHLMLTPWLSIHPSLQWIQHPSGDPALQNAVVGMLRMDFHPL